MESLLNLALSLLFVPMVGAAVLFFAGTACQVAMAPTTPGYQRFLWCLGVGFIVVELAGTHWR